MRMFLRVLSGIFFTPLLLLFLILTSLTFQILNGNYLIPAFERYQVYEKLPVLLSQSLPNDPNIPEDEREAYAEIAASIKPETAKQILEGILRPILDYVHGKSDDIEISLNNINWKLSSNPPNETLKSIQLLNGVWNKLVIAWVIILITLVGLGFFIGKAILLIDGILIVLYSLVIKFFLIQMARDLPNQGEPAQKLLGLLAGTILPEIINIWAVVGIVLIIIWILIKLKNFLKRR